MDGCRRLNCLHDLFDNLLYSFASHRLLACLPASLLSALSSRAYECIVTHHVNNQPEPTLCASSLDPPPRRWRTNACARQCSIPFPRARAASGCCVGAYVELIIRDLSSDTHTHTYPHPHTDDASPDTHISCPKLRCSGSSTNYRDGGPCGKSGACT